MGRGEVAELPPGDDGDVADDGGHGVTVDGSGDGEDGGEEERPVSDVGLQDLEDVSSALSGETHRQEAGREDHQQTHQGLESHQRRPLAADRVADHLDVSEDIGEAGHDDEKREEGGPEPAGVEGGECFEDEDDVTQTDIVTEH